MENKEFYINSFCYAVVFIPIITAFIYLVAMIMDYIY